PIGSSEPSPMHIRPAREGSEASVFLDPSNAHSLGVARAAAFAWPAPEGAERRASRLAVTPDLGGRGPFVAHIHQSTRSSCAICASREAQRHHICSRPIIVLACSSLLHRCSPMDF